MATWRDVVCLTLRCSRASTHRTQDLTVPNCVPHTHLSTWEVCSKQMARGKVRRDKKTRKQKWRRTTSRKKKTRGKKQGQKKDQKVCGEGHYSFSSSFSVGSVHDDSFMASLATVPPNMIWPHKSSAEAAKQPKVSLPNTATSLLACPMPNAPLRAWWSVYRLRTWCSQCVWVRPALGVPSVPDAQYLVTLKLHFLCPWCKLLVLGSVCPVPSGAGARRAFLLGASSGRVPGVQGCPKCPVSLVSLVSEVLLVHLPTHFLLVSFSVKLARKSANRHNVERKETSSEHSCSPKFRNRAGKRASTGRARGAFQQITCQHPCFANWLMYMKFHAHFGVTCVKWCVWWMGACLCGFCVSCVCVWILSLACVGIWYLVCVGVYSGRAPSQSTFWQQTHALLAQTHSLHTHTHVPQFWVVLEMSIFANFSSWKAVRLHSLRSYKVRETHTQHANTKSTHTQNKFNTHTHPHTMHKIHTKHKIHTNPHTQTQIPHTHTYQTTTSTQTHTKHTIDTHTSHSKDVSMSAQKQKTAFQVFAKKAVKHAHEIRAFTEPAQKSLHGPVSQPLTQQRFLTRIAGFLQHLVASTLESPRDCTLIIPASHQHSYQQHTSIPLFHHIQSSVVDRTLRVLNHSRGSWSKDAKSRNIDFRHDVRQHLLGTFHWVCANVHHALLRTAASQSRCPCFARHRERQEIPISHHLRPSFRTSLRTQQWRRSYQFTACNIADCPVDFHATLRLTGSFSATSYSTPPSGVHNTLLCAAFDRALSGRKMVVRSAHSKFLSLSWRSA